MRRFRGAGGRWHDASIGCSDGLSSIRAEPDVRSLPTAAGSCVDDARVARRFWRCCLRSGASHVPGLFARCMTAGPDVIRGSGNRWVANSRTIVSNAFNPSMREVSEVLCKRFPLGIVSFCVLLLQRAEEAKRSPNWMANWPMAAVHSMGLRQCTPAFLMAR